MTLKVDKRSIGKIIKDYDEELKTPHEEVMFVVESTNDIVSEIVQLIEYIFPKSYKDFKAGKKR